MGKKTQEKERNRINYMTTFIMLQNLFFFPGKKTILKIEFQKLNLRFEYFCCLPDHKKCLE